MKHINIRKIGGETEEFSISKLRRSIINSGATEEVTEGIIRQVVSKQKELRTTADIHQIVYSSLVATYPHIAARYSLKKALHMLGPTGYPFEKYIGSIYKYMGYDTKVGVILEGKCVDHEIDVIARTHNDIVFIECKYHQSQSAKSNVKIPLYVKSRMEDLFNRQLELEKPSMNFSFFIATNTRFTDDAVKYSGCHNLNLLSWVQPTSDPLPKIIDRYGLHPVTALTCLTRNQAKRLIDLGVVLIRDVPHSRREIVHAGIPKDLVDTVIGESEAILAI